MPRGSSDGALPRLASRAWLFTAAELRMTPSRVSGVPAATEARVVARTARFLQECARELAVPQLTICAAMTFFQRFYMLESMSAHEPVRVAAACLFLACKVQETMKRLKDIIYWTAKVRTRNTDDYPDGVDVREDSPAFVDEKIGLLDKEREVLRVLDFDLTCDLPYKHLWALSKSFLHGSTDLQDGGGGGGGGGGGALEAASEHAAGNTKGNVQRAVMQSAWNFLNDSFRLYVHVRYPPPVIATAVFFLAAKLHDYSLPDGTGTCPKSGKRLLAWHEFYDVDVEHIEHIADTVLALYEEENTGEGGDRSKGPFR